MRIDSIGLVMVVATLACTGSEAPASRDTAASMPRVQRESTVAVRADDDNYTISASGVGPVRLGMTLGEARSALPKATFARTTDGDGAALIEVTLAPDTTMILWADEEDANKPVDWSKRIASIQTFSAAFHTRAGVHPGTLVADAERAYGKTTLITLTEIEQRQYIEFEAQPAELSMRLDYTGVFEGSSRTTKAFRPGAKILSITVSTTR